MTAWLLILDIDPLVLPPNGALPLDLYPHLLPSTREDSSGWDAGAARRPVTTSQISAILCFFLESFPSGWDDGRLLWADGAGSLFLAEHPHHLPTPENQPYDQILYSATPSGAKDRKILRLDRPSAPTQRLCASHDPSGPSAVPVPGLSGRSTRRQLLPQREDLRRFGVGLDPVRDRPRPAHRPEAHRLRVVQRHEPQWSLPSVAGRWPTTQLRRSRLQLVTKVSQDVDQGPGSIVILEVSASNERLLRPGLVQAAANELVGDPDVSGMLRITNEVAV